MCIQTGQIVWVNDPFPCGTWSDINIFRSGLKHMLEPGEKAEADNGYKGEPHHIALPGGVNNRDQTIARARHETVNRRFKQFGCLERVFRHNLEKHSSVFRAVAVITELSLENGQPLFGVEY